MKHNEFHSLPGKPIRQYIMMRNNGYYSDRERGGVLVGVNLGNGTFNVDYAIANNDYEDEFNADLGTRIAYGRAIAYRNNKKRKRFFAIGRADFPREEDILRAYVDFCARCQKYYKDCAPSAKTLEFWNAAEDDLRSVE